MHTANDLNTGLLTPANGFVNGNGNAAANGNASAAVKALAAQLLDRPEPDGATVHCLSISETCCKIGRITVPPALVIAIDGFSCAPPSGSGLSAYSHADPPPHWERVRKLRGEVHALDAPKAGGRGSLKSLRDFYTKDWRDVPEGKRWWEDALGGEVEERRLRGLGGMQALRRGIEEARSI